MDTKDNFLNKVCQEIKYKPARRGIAEELELHIEDIKEDYLKSGVVTDMIQGGREEGAYNKFTVPENCVFALGDNRTGSIDCRSFGCIPLEKIEGKVLFRFWPFSKFGGVK